MGGGNKDDEMFNLFNNTTATYSITSDTINIPGNVNIAELNVGNLQATSTLSGNINIANLYSFDTSNFTSENITSTVLLKAKDVDVSGNLTVDGDVEVVGNLDVSGNLGVNTINGADYDKLVISSNIKTAIHNIEGSSIDSSFNFNMKNLLYDTNDVIYKEEAGLDSGAKYIFEVPPNFNGGVFLYSHGFRFPYDLNLNNLLLPGGNLNASTFVDNNTRNFLLDLGFALIGSGFETTGYNTPGAIQDNLDLLDLFKSRYPQTNKVILWGDSLGGNITAALAERHPDLFDAVGIKNGVDEFEQLVEYAGDLIWFIKNTFNPTIPVTGFGFTGFGFSTNEQARAEQVRNDFNMLQLLLSSLQENKSWQYFDSSGAGLGPIGKTFKTMSLNPLLAGLTPATVFSVFAAAVGLPLKSGHFGENTDPLGIGAALLENLLNAGGLGLQAIANFEKLFGGRVYKNNTTNYTTMGHPKFSEYNSLVLEPIQNTPGIRETGPNYYRFFDDEYVTQLHGNITKPTYFLHAIYDPAVLIQCSVVYQKKYDSQVLDSSANPNSLFHIVAVPPLTPPNQDWKLEEWYDDTFKTPSKFGTGHAYYSGNNEMLLATLLINAAYSGTLLSDTNQNLSKLKKLLSSCDANLAPLKPAGNLAELLALIPYPNHPDFNDSR
jgi:pimeloyl-ACP methyl ester carboxylesterase